MAVNLSMLAGAGAQFFTDSGVILSGGLVYTYAAGTTTPQTTYTTSAGNVAHTNPIVLNSAGRVASGGEIWLTDAVSYKFVLQTSTAVTIATYDNVTGNSSGIYAAFAASSGSSLVGYTQGGTGAVATTVQAKLRETVSVKDFGAVGDGTTDDTAAIQAAITYALSTGKSLVGVGADTYNITASLTVVGNDFYFDGNGCRFKNSISNVSGAAPLFAISNSSTSNLNFSNFRVIGTANNGHVFSNIGVVATGPQFIIVDNVWVTAHSGNGLDRLGVSMVGQFFYSYGGASIRLHNCTSYLSGGVYFDNVLKFNIFNLTVDSPPAGNLLYCNQCNNGVVDGDSIFNGGTTDQVVLNRCVAVSVTKSRLKGSAGRQFFASGAGSSGIVFENNNLEIYNTTTDAVQVTTAVSSPFIGKNTFLFVGSGATTFNFGGIGLVDESGGGFISTGAVIQNNTFVLGSLLTVAYLIQINSTLNSVRGARIAHNTLAIAGASGSGNTITVGINIAGTSFGCAVEQNAYGAYAGTTVTTGITVGASATGTRLIDNYNIGNCTTAITDSGSKTNRIESGVVVPVSWTPAVSGTTTAGVGTYSLQTGSYTLAANIANINVQLIWSAHTGTGSMTVNLPFTVTNRFQTLSIFVDNLTYSGQVQAAVSGGSSSIRFWSETTGAGSSQINLDAAASFYISGQLEIA